MSTLDDINALFEDFGPVVQEKPQQIQEKIDVKSSSMGEVIKDFRKSKAPQFRGKSPAKKREMAIAAKLSEEVPTAPQTYQERLMGDVDKYISAHRRVEPNVKPLTEVPLDEERIKNIETKLDQVRLLFHEATMVSGIGQGGDGQTPGSGEVKLARLDDVIMDNIQDGNSLIWDSAEGKFVPGTATGGGTTGVDRIIAGTGIDTNPAGGIGQVEVILDATVSDLSDVTGTPVDGSVLVYNGTNWNAAGLNTSNVQLTNPQGNPYNLAAYTRYDVITSQMYTTQEEANQLFGALITDLDQRIEVLEPDPGAPDADNIGDLDDVQVVGAITGSILEFDDGSGMWNAVNHSFPESTTGTILPNTGQEDDGDFFYKTDTDELYIYSQVWTLVGGGGASVNISANAPAGELGDLWVSSDDWILYVHDGFNWIGLTNNGVTAPTTSSVDGTELKSIVAASTDFADFQSRIANYDF